MLSPTACSAHGWLLWDTMIYGGKVPINKQAALFADLWLNLEGRKEVERTKVRSRWERTARLHSMKATAALRTKLVVCVWHGGDLSNIAMQVHRKQKALQFEATTYLWIIGKASHLVIRLIAGIKLHLIRCVKKIKLAKIISQLFCSLRRRNSSFTCITVLLRMHTQTYTKCPAWGFWSFSVVISPLRYSSVGAAEQRVVKANSNTGKSRKTELLTF